ncbi:hypothetical protein AGMMS49940_16910 [Spirochaetia bacterium]|nr:hypothetical protein AGMMS49940_16910 [Spirochaetia bacterium]
MRKTIHPYIGIADDLGYTCMMIALIALIIRFKKLFVASMALTALLIFVGCPDPTIPPVTPPNTVSYHANGGIGSVPPAAQYEVGASVTVAVKPGNLSKNGNDTFAGWNTHADGSGSSYTAGNTFTMGTVAITLYAQWAPYTPSKTFNAQSAVDNSWYTVNARQLAEGAHCIIYADETQGISIATAQAIVTKYDSFVHSQITGAFGNIEDVDGNGKVIFLLLDILDGYTGSGGYVAGYFDPTHMFSTSVYTKSNVADMLFMDTNPGLDPADPDVMQGFYSTMAHELQHLIEFSETYLKGMAEKDLWINEGLSTAAEYIYGDGTGSPAQQTSRIAYFNAAGTSIPYGNNFFVWNGYWEQEENGGDVLADYATAYLFFQWLRIHASSGVGIYKDIIASTHGDYRAVTEAAFSKISSLSTSGNSETDWGTLLGNWLLANAIRSSTGLLGYQNQITTTAYLLTGASILLSPGEAVFSSITGVSVSTAGFTSGSHIKYVGIPESGNLDTEGPQYDGKYLLTFNANSNKDWQNGLNDERGKLASNVVGGLQTSVQMPLNRSIAPVPSSPLPASYPIDVHFGADGKLSPDSPRTGTPALKNAPKDKGISAKPAGMIGK